MSTSRTDRSRGLAPRHALTVALAIGLGAAFGAAHGPKSKPFFNDTKQNATTRGGVGAGAAQLYMMQPERHLTGAHDLVGYDITLEDGDPLTVETVELSIVRFDATGVAPDESIGGLITKRSFFVFGFPPPTGGNAFKFTLTTGNPLTLPHRFGVGIRLAAAPTWPVDGLSVHAQLNLQNDPLRPRVPANHQSETWAYERMPTSPSATPLGGRSLDALQVSPLVAGSVLQGFVRSSAYGGGTEDLYGPESMYPSAARGDWFGVFAHASSPSFPFLFVYASPRQLPTPWCCSGPANGYWYLDLAPPFPIQIAAVVLDANGQATIGPFPIASVPPGLRELWMQGIVVSTGMQAQLTDAISFKGL